MPESDSLPAIRALRESTRKVHIVMPPGKTVGAVRDLEQAVDALLALVDELAGALRETREAVGACFRVIYAEIGPLPLEAEMHRVGVQNGFGKRADDLLKKYDSANDAGGEVG